MGEAKKDFPFTQIIKYINENSPVVPALWKFFIFRMRKLTRCLSLHSKLLTFLIRLDSKCFAEVIFN